MTYEMVAFSNDALNNTMRAAVCRNYEYLYKNAAKLKLAINAAIISYKIFQFIIDFSSCAIKNSFESSPVYCILITHNLKKRENPLIYKLT